MATDDRSGLELRRRLSLWLGADAADELMNRIPPISWTDVATKRDVEQLGDDLRAEFRTDLDALATQLRSETQMLGADLRSEFVEAANRQTKWLVTFAAAWTTVLVTLVRVIG